MSARTVYHISEPDLSPELSAVTRFTPDQIVAVRYPSGNFELDRMIEFWTLMKTPVRDHENGSGHRGTLSWIYEHLPIFKADGLYQLFAFLYKPTGELIAIGAVVDEDRGVLRQKNLIANGLWGYFNVDWRLRGRGLGKIITGYIDGHVYRYAARTSTPLTMYLFTADPVAMHLYGLLDWRPSGDAVSVPDFAEVEGLPDQEKLYCKVYLPGDGSIAAQRPQLTSYENYV